VNIQPWGYAGKSIELGQEAPVMSYVTYNYYVEDGDTRRLIKTDYDINMPVGATIPITSLEILNKYKAFVNSLNLGVFGDGRVLNEPISSTVSLNPAENVVDIEYIELSTYKVTVTYHFEDQRLETRVNTRGNYMGDETIVLPQVERGTTIDLAFLTKYADFSIRKEPKELAGTDQWFVYAHHSYNSDSNYGELPIPSLEEDVHITLVYLRNEHNISVTYAYYYEHNNQEVLLYTDVRSDLYVGETIPLDATVLNAKLKTVNSLGLGTFHPGTIKTYPDSPTVSENAGKNIVEILYRKGATPQSYTVTLHHWDANNDRDLIPPRQITGVRYGEIISRDYIYGLMNEDPSLSDLMPWTIDDNGTTYHHLESFTIISQGEGTGAPVVYEGVPYSQFPAPIPGNDVHVYFQYAHTYVVINYYDVFGQELRLLPGNQYQEYRFDVQPGQVIDENSTDFIRDFSAEGYVPFSNWGLPLTISQGGNYFDIRYSPPWNETNVYLVYYREVLCRVGTYREGETINIDAHIASIDQDLILAGFAGGTYNGDTYTAGIPRHSEYDPDVSYIDTFDQIEDTSVPIIMQPNKTKNIAIYVQLSY